MVRLNFSEEVRLKFESLQMNQIEQRRQSVRGQRTELTAEILQGIFDAGKRFDRKAFQWISIENQIF